MQRAIIFIGCLLCLGFDLNSQIEHLRTFEDEARCRLSESNNMFIVEDFSTVGSTMKDAQYLRAVEIVNGNMVFRFSLPDLVSQEYYVLDWNISIGSREFRIAPETMSYHVIRADAQAKMYEVIWYSPFDQVPLGLEEFHLILRADFYGLPCPFAQGFEPKFGWKEQRYHFGAIALGGA